MERNTRETLFNLKQLDNRSSSPILSKIITKNDTSLTYAQENIHDTCNKLSRMTIRHFMLTGYYGLLSYTPSRQQQLLIDILSQHLLALDLQRYRQQHIICHFDQYAQPKKKNPLPDFLNIHKKAHIKSRIGLSSYLSRYYRLPITVTESLETWLPIHNPHPPKLAITAYLGKNQLCKDDKLELIIGPMSYKQFKQIIANKTLLDHIQQHTHNIFDKDYRVTIKIMIQTNKIPQTRLVNSKKKKLGLNAFLRFRSVQYLQAEHDDQQVSKIFSYCHFSGN